VYELDPDKSGTIHTAQGKEADVVIVVLGGNPKSTGAKAWAASKPNLLNVAVSRGKKRLYVIGDVGLWRRHNHFSAMAGLMSIEGVRCS
jgi:superfamily I DNA and/or RNA helicase